MSGNLPIGAPEDGYARLIGLARDAGVRVALDAREDALAAGVAARPDIVKVNAEEAEWLLGEHIVDVEDGAAAARQIRDRLAAGA
ncbi:MAG TPA: PfkB family carbohydrate kinase, partial [Actinomycetota bacterium]|nr:PfkB family carbohydrate kinase [Actinomycetota bacterium]